MRNQSPAPAVGEDSWFTGIRFAGVAAAFIALTYPRILVGAGTFVFRDYGFFNYPLAFWFREQFWRGELPLWNPLNSCGIPFLAQWNTLACYPPSLLYLLLPMPWSLGLFTLLHWLLGAIGMYGFVNLRTRHPFAASVAGLTYAFNGLTINCLMWPHMTAAIGWMPWVMLAVTRTWRRGGRSVLAAAIVGGFQLLTGAPELILLTWSLLALMFVLERREFATSLPVLAGRTAVVAGLMSGLAAVQLFPFFQLLAGSHRDTAHFHTESALPLYGWANLFLPLFRALKSPVGIYYQHGQFWTTSYYFSIVVVAVAAYAVWKPRGHRSRGYAAAALVALLLAFGDPGWIYSLVRRVLPVVNLVNFPVKYLLAWLFLIPLLAAFGIETLETGTTADRKADRRRLVLVGTALLSFLSGLLLSEIWLAPAATAGSAALSNAAVRAAVLGVGLTLLLLRQRRTGPGNRLERAAGFGLLVLIWMDVRIHAPEQNPVVNPLAFQPHLQRLTPDGPESAQKVSRLMLSREARQRSDRVTLADPLQDYLGHRFSQTMNCNLLDGFAKVDGFYPLFLREQIDVLRLLYSRTNAATFPLADFLSVSHVSTPGNPSEFSPRASFLPMVTAGQKPVFADSATALRALGSDAFDPIHTVYLPPEARNRLTATNGGRATIVSDRGTAQGRQVTVEASQPSLMVFSQAWYPCWRAEVDGHPARIWRANHAFQALELPAGRSEVVIRYRDHFFVLGLLISSSTLCATWLGWRRAAGARRMDPGR